MLNACRVGILVLSCLCLGAVNAQPSSSAGLDWAKKKCAELGFKEKTEPFGNCVLQLSREDALPAAAPTSPAPKLNATVNVPVARDVTKPGSTFKDCPDCPDMVAIPAGNFEMGGTNANERPVHRVTVSSFSMGKTEVTQGQWRAVMGTNPSIFSNCGDSCPVENVGWYDAKQFIMRLSAKTGKGYRLPSEAEWEYACRAGGRDEYCGGDRIDDVAWHEKNSGRSTHPVAAKQANAWGLHDMSGNVFEWTADCWNGNYDGAPTDGSALKMAGDCYSRVVRGGGVGERS